MSKRNVIGLGAALEKRLVAYAVAGAAALGVCAPSADGEIVYTSVRASGPVNIDLNRDGITDFHLGMLTAVFAIYTPR